MIRHSLLLVGAVAMCCLMISSCAPSEQSTTGDFVLISEPSFVKTWDVQLPLHAGDTVKGIYYLDGNIHVLTNKSYDHVVKGDSGASLYNFQIGSADSTLQGGPALVRDGIVFPTTHTLELYDRSGNFVRSIDVKYNITNQAVGHNNYVYIGMDFRQGCLAQVDVTQDIDAVQWEYLTGGPVDGPVAISDNVVFSASEDGNIRGCLEDKTPFWPLLPDSAFDTKSAIYSGVVADSHSVYCATSAGTFICLDKNSGKLKWQYFSGQPLEFGPQVTDSAIYQYVPGLGLCALDKSKKIVLGDQETVDEAPFHSPRWSLKSAGRILDEDDNYVYVVLGRPDQTRGLAAVDKQTGEIKFRTHRRDLLFVTCQPKAALIYGVTAKGLVVAIKPVSEPGSYGELAENSDSSLDGLTAHAR